MPESQASPLGVFTEHAKAILGLAAAVAGAVFGTAHWAFYEQLDVQPGDVGLGPAEIVSQAAIGLVLTLLFFAFVVGAMTLIYAMGWSIVGSTPVNWEQALAMGVVGAAMMASGTMTGVLTAVALGDSAVIVVLTATLAVPLVMFEEGWRDRRAAESREPARPNRGRVGWAALIGFAVLVVPMAAAVAIDDARAVRRGVVPASLLHSLVGGPITCVEPEPSKAPTRYLLHLGTGDTHEVLFWPGHGPVRVPAGDVVLLPAAPSKCRPSR